jgi:hypothetical protein
MTRRPHDENDGYTGQAARDPGARRRTRAAGHNVPGHEVPGAAMDGINQTAAGAPMQCRTDGQTVDQFAPDELIPKPHEFNPQNGTPDSIAG